MYFCNKLITLFKPKVMNKINYSTNSASDPFNGVLISMIDMKKVGKLGMDTCSCQAVETQHIETRDDEGNCTCRILCQTFL